MCYIFVFLFKCDILKNEKENSEIEIDPDLILQIFSPMITSQRIMNCHFSNCYSSMQCENGINIVFDEVNMFNIQRLFNIHLIVVIKNYVFFYSTWVICSFM